jgi:hypothetical protein
MTKLTRVAIAVICSRPSGYRRAGFSLNQGENLIDANKAQYDALIGDKHLTVSIASDNEEFVTDDFNNGDLEDQITVLKSELAKSTALLSVANDDIKALEERLEAAVAANSRLNENGKVVEMDFSWAPEPLAPWIAVLHKMHTQTPLTKRPKVAELEVEVPADGEREAFMYKPTAAQADEAWAYYSDNVINHVPDSAKG